MEKRLPAKITIKEREVSNKKVLEILCRRDGDYVVTVYGKRVVKVGHIRKAVLIEDLLENGDVVFDGREGGS